MAEQILIEFIGDTTQLVPAIDILEKLGQIDAKAAEAFRQGNAELEKKAQVSAKVTGQTDKQIKSTKDLENGVIRLSDALADAASSDITKGLEAVGEKMDVLTKRAKESGKSVLEIVTAQEQLKQKLKESTSLGPFQKLSKDVQDAENKVLSLSARLNNLTSKGITDGPLFDKLNKELPIAQAELGKLKGQYDAVTGSIKQNKEASNDLASADESLRQQLRQMTAELAQLELAGKRNTKEYTDLVTRAGEVRDAIQDAGDAISNAGSDTRGLDNVLTLAQGVAGGFAVAQGAAALFGEQSEQVQQALLKVNAAMAILQGLQQIQDIMSKRQFQSMAALIGLQKVQALQTVLQAGAESNYTIVRYASIAAQKVLNAVMAASPLGVVLLLVGAIATAYALFADNGRDAAAAQDELNESLRRSTEFLESDLKLMDRQRARAIAYAKEQGKNIIDLDKIEGEYGNKRLNRLSGQIAANAKTLNTITSNDKESLELRTKLEQKNFDLSNQLEEERASLELKASEFRKSLYERDIKSYTAFQDAKVFQARKGSIAELEAQIDAAKAARKLALDRKITDTNNGERAKIEAETNRQILELDNQITIKRLENQKFLMEAKLATLRQGSIAELQEQKLVSSKTIEIELAALGISEEKKKAIRAKGAQEQKEFDRQIIDKRLQSDVTGIQIALAKTKEGSVEEFNLKLDQLSAIKLVELNAKGLSIKEQILIEKKYLKDVEELTRQTNKKITEEAINIKQAEINAKLAELQKASTSQTNEDVLKLKQEAVDKQAALDIVSANFSIQNEELKQVRIKEIIAKANADKLALDEAYKIAIINNDLEITNTEIENEKKRATIILFSGNKTIGEKIRAGKLIKALSKEQLDNETTANENKYSAGLIDEETYQKNRLAIEGKYLDLELDRVNEHEEHKKAIRLAALHALQEVSNSLFEIDKTRRDAELADQISKLEAQKDVEINVKNITEQQKSDIDKHYHEKEAHLKRQAWIADKNAKKEQAVINGALAITMAFAQLGPVYGAIAAALVAVSTGLQIAKINSEPVPQFRKGTKNAPKGYAIVGEDGPEIIYLKGGEKIYTHPESKKIMAGWEGGRVALTPDEILAGKIPHVDQTLYSNTYVGNGGVVIDYEQFGKAVAKHTPDKPQFIFNYDENGAALSLNTKNSKIEIRNKRYKLD